MVGSKGPLGFEGIPSVLGGPGGTPGVWGVPWSLRGSSEVWGFPEEMVTFWGGPVFRGSVLAARGLGVGAEHGPGAGVGPLLEQGPGRRRVRSGLGLVAFGQPRRPRPPAATPWGGSLGFPQNSGHPNNPQPSSPPVPGRVRVSAGIHGVQFLVLAATWGGDRGVSTAQLWGMATPGTLGAPEIPGDPHPPFLLLGYGASSSRRWKRRSRGGSSFSWPFSGGSSGSGGAPRV